MHTSTARDSIPGVFDPPAAAAQATRELLAWPWPRQWPAGEEMWPLARYVHNCTRPEDRLLVTWNAPHLFVVTGRPFAGTETVLLPLWRETPSYEMPLSRRIMRTGAADRLGLDRWLGGVHR